MQRSITIQVHLLYFGLFGSFFFSLRALVAFLVIALPTSKYSPCSFPTFFTTSFATVVLLFFLPQEMRKGPFTPEEDNLVLQRVAEWGDKGQVHVFFMFLFSLRFFSRTVVLVYQCSAVYIIQMHFYSPILTVALLLILLLSVHRACGRV